MTKAASPSAAWAVRPRQRDDVQGLRAVAVVSVVLYHAGVDLPGGFTGVDIFFTVSGFVITAMLLRELQATGRIGFRAFYARRVRRLLPALALVSLVTLAATALLLSPVGTDQSVAAQAAASASLFLANGFFFRNSGGYFQPIAQMNPFLHTWSLSVEEQFYLLFPVLLLVAWRLGRRRLGPVAGLIGLVGAASLVACIGCTYGHFVAIPGFRLLASDPVYARSWAFYSPVTRGWEFVAGALVALYTARERAAAQRSARRTRGCTAAAATGLALLALAFGLVHDDAPFPGLLAALPVGGTALLLLAGSTGNPLSRALGVRPLVAIGDLSYSWYLWHWPAIVVVRSFWPSSTPATLTAALLSVLPAYASLRLLENPVRRRRRLPSARGTALVLVAAVTVPVLCAAALYEATVHSWSSTRISAIRAVVVPEHVDEADDCLSTAPLGSPGRPVCLFRAPGDGRGTILLVGDSNAGHIAEPIINAAHSQGFAVQVATDGGCPFIVRTTYVSELCGAEVAGTLAYLRRDPHRYAAIVVSNADIAYLTGATAHDDAAEAAAIDRWTSDQRRTVSLISSPRTPVIIAGAVPQFPAVPGCLYPRLVSPHRAAGCGHLDPDSLLLRLRDKLIASEQAAVAGSATFLDLGPGVCNRIGCDVYRGSQLMYRDGSHLSVAGSLRYTGQFRATLAAVLASRPAG